MLSDEMGIIRIAYKLYWCQLTQFMKPFFFSKRLILYKIIIILCISYNLFPEIAFAVKWLATSYRTVVRFPAGTNTFINTAPGLTQAKELVTHLNPRSRLRMLCSIILVSLHRAVPTNN